jgi:regulator of cell morphogenesis and NO signaling
MTMSVFTLVADIATANPATIKVFQRHRIDFCCGGKRPLGEVCTRHHIDPEALLQELELAQRGVDDTLDASAIPLTDLVAYIQRRFHRPLVIELPRLAAMIDKVVSRHGDRFPERLQQLQSTFATLQRELLAHMATEDIVLFPAVVALEAGRPAPGAGSGSMWIEQPIHVMETEHEAAGAALATIAELTDRYTPPADACPTFRGLYYGLSELEREMHVHVHLENHVLFPRAAALARRCLAG